MTADSEKILHKIAAYFSDKPVKRVAVFGSYARGEENTGSDIDLIITLTAKSHIGLFALAKFKTELEDLTGKKVDLGTEGGISKFVLPYIDKDLKIIYEK